MLNYYYNNVVSKKYEIIFLFQQNTVNKIFNFFIFHPFCLHAFLNSEFLFLDPKGYGTETTIIDKIYYVRSVDKCHIV